MIDEKLDFSQGLMVDKKFVGLYNRDLMDEILLDFP